MLRIEVVENINHTPGLQLAVEGHAELLQAGLSDDVAMVHWDHKAVIAFVDRQDPGEAGAAVGPYTEAVGVISFGHLEWARQFDIYIGYVRRPHRHRGVYTALWKRLVEEAQKRGVAIIQGTTDVKNAPMRAVAKTLGRTEQAVVLHFRVPPAEAPGA